MTAQVPVMTRRAVTRRLPGAGLDGAALSLRVWLLLAAGTAGGLVLGPGGWVQQLNFIVFGLLVCLSAAGWRTALAPGRGALAFTVLRVIAGVGLVMDGLFAQDPSGGYRQGARVRVPTVHGQVRTLFAIITITALASGCFVLARRFAAEPSWRRWAILAAAAGMATLVFIAAFGVAGGHGGPAGLWERAAGAATSVLTVAVLARLAVTNRPAVRARRLGLAGEVA